VCSKILLSTSFIVRKEEMTLFASDYDLVEDSSSGEGADLASEFFKLAQRKGIGSEDLLEEHKTTKSTTTCIASDGYILRSLSCCKNI
jgi:hypothetical protein